MAHFYNSPIPKASYLKAMHPRTHRGRISGRELVETRGGKVVNEESNTIILEFTGDKEELEEILTRLEGLGMEDFAPLRRHRPVERGK